MICVYRTRSGTRCTHEAQTPVEIRFQGQQMKIMVCGIHQLKYHNDPINFGRDLLAGMKNASSAST